CSSCSSRKPSMLAALLAETGGGAAELPADVDPDTRIRARLRACRDGMAQLDALREKHERLMESMRGGFRLSTPEVKRKGEEKKMRSLKDEFPLMDINGNREIKERNEYRREEDQGFCEPYQKVAETLLIPVDQLRAQQDRAKGGGS
ncbi:hypothetical protein PFISCL1PPCAC_19043, partial [Pristionchus fissidentatus]